MMEEEFYTIVETVLALFEEKKQMFLCYELPQEKYSSKAKKY